MYSRLRATRLNIVEYSMALLKTFTSGKILKSELMILGFINIRLGSVMLVAIVSVSIL